MTNPSSGVSTITQIGVIGSGVMGQGIAQLVAQSRLKVKLYDSNPLALNKAVEAIHRLWTQLAEKGRISHEQAEESRINLVPISDLTQLAGSHLVVEAIVEDLDIKQDLFSKLEEICGEDVILATNTSSLSVSSVAARCKRPENVVGWHFFNPVPLMKLAEVVSGELTNPTTADVVVRLTEQLGHKPVRTVDSPGFLVNHAGRAFIPEGLRLLSEGIASHEQIDEAIKSIAGFKMGPFELLDLVGLDVGLKVMSSLYHQFLEEPRFRITPLVSRKVAAGLLGRKSGEGFYKYQAAVTSASPDKSKEASIEHADRSCSVWISNVEPDLATRLAEKVRSTATIESGMSPSDQSLILITPVGEDVSTYCSRNGLDARRTVAVNTLFSLERACELMASPALEEPWRNQATKLMQAVGLEPIWLRDSPGFVTQRVVAQIINIGADMAQHRIGKPVDIDHAVMIALGYPKGPFSFARMIGAKRALQISEALYAAYNEDRYRPSVWLKRRAMLNLQADTTD